MTPATGPQLSLPLGDSPTAISTAPPQKSSPRGHDDHISSKPMLSSSFQVEEKLQEDSRRKLLQLPITKFLSLTESVPIFFPLVTMKEEPFL